MERAWPRWFWWAALGQALVLLGSLGGWFLVRTRAYLAAPSGGDLYAHTWSYQALMFFITYGATAVLLFVLLISFEFIVWNWFTSRHEDSPAGEGGNRAP